MATVCNPCAHLVGGDEALRALLSEVLNEMGVWLAEEEPVREAVPDVMLVHVQRGANILRLLEQARAAAHRAPVLVLLPFDDEPLARLALRSGAWGYFALGRPLQELCSILGAALEASAQAAADPDRRARRGTES